MITTTGTVTILEAGQADNVVPSHALAVGQLPPVARLYRFLPARLGAEDLTRVHGVDERIAIDNYLEIIRFYAQLLLNAAG